MEQVKTKPFVQWPMHDEKEVLMVNEIINSGKWWRMNGTKVTGFEEKFAQYHDCKYCLGVTNGTHALELSLKSLGIGDGDEVIVPAFTFISTFTAVLSCNAVPIVVDVDPETFCIDCDSMEKSITSKTKAIIVVHMAGHACDMDKVN